MNRLFTFITPIFFFNVFLLLISPHSVKAQNFEWARSFGGQDFDFGSNVEVDDNGNIYVAGFYKLTVDFDPGPGVYNMTSNGNYDMYVSKFDPSGNLIWAKSIGGTDDDYLYNIKVNQDGIYIAGNCGDSIDFDPGIDTVYQFLSGRSFLCKLDLLGNFEFIKRVSSISVSSSENIAFDNQNNIYVASFFNYTVSSSSFVVEVFNNGGDTIRKIAMNGGGGNFNASTILVDSLGFLYISGWFSGTFDFDKSVAVNSLTAVGAWDIFHLKLDSIGNFVWANSTGSSNSDECSNIVMDQQNYIYSTGSFQGSMTFGTGVNSKVLTSNGSDDVYISKYDNNGNIIWARNFGSTNYDEGRSIKVGHNGDVFVLGYFTDSAFYDTIGSPNYLVANGSYDIFLLRLDSSGNLVLAQRFGGGSFEDGRSLEIDKFGSVYATGYFDGVVDFDPPNLYNLTTVGNRDVFLVKYLLPYVDIPEVINVLSLQIYPNPTSDKLRIEFPALSPPSTIYLTDFVGKKLLEFKISNQKFIDLSLPYTNGLYFINWMWNGNLYSYKVVKI